MGLKLDLGLGLGKGGGQTANLQFLDNGFTAPDTLTTGALYVADNLGVLRTAGVDKVAIPGARLSGSDFVLTDTEGAQIFTSASVRTKSQGSVTQYTDADWQGMLVMPARTELFTAPNDFTNAAWGVFGGCAKVGVNMSYAGPDGVTGVMEISFGATGGAFITSSALYQIFTRDGANNHTGAFYLRTKTGTTTVRLGCLTDAGSESDVYNITETWTEFSHTAVPRTTNPNFSVRNNIAGNSANVLIAFGQMTKSDYSTPPITTSPRAATVASFNTANRIRTQNQALWLRRYVTAAGQTAWALNSIINDDNETGLQFQPTALMLRKRVGGANADLSLSFTAAANDHTDVQLAWTDKGMLLRASADRGATWTAWATNTHTGVAEIGETMQAGRNGADQLACGLTFTGTMFLPTLGTLDDYKTFIETDAKWANIG